MSQKQFRILWVSLLAILIVWLLVHTLVPSGKVTYATDFSKSSYYFDPLLPIERVTDNRKIIDEPVYFTTYVTRPFQKAIVTINFMSPTPAFSVGVAHNKAQWVYDFKQVKENSLQTVLEFDLSQAERIRGKYSFMISDPSLKTQTKSIIIKNISVQFFGPLL